MKITTVVSHVSAVVVLWTILLCGSTAWAGGRHQLCRELGIFWGDGYHAAFRREWCPCHSAASDREQHVYWARKQALPQKDLYQGRPPRFPAGQSLLDW